jgi:hypothetical protein
MRSVLLFFLGWSVIAPAANGPAKFFARRDYGPGADLVRVADVNGDGIPDLVELNLYSYTINIMLGNGDGTFRAGRTFKPNLSFPYSSGLAALDLNGDGKIDLVITGAANGFGGIGVCFGNGDGTFQQPIFYPAGTDESTGALVMGDFNGDGIPDAVITGEYSGVWLLIGKGGGVFSPGVLTPAPPQGASGAAGGRLAAADFNGDGYLDLAVAFSFPSGFMVLLGNGNGTFQKPALVYVPLYGSVGYIAVGDLNQDGYPDIVLSPTGASVSYVDVFLNNGKGGFSKHSQVNMNGAVEITIGDVNGDGIPDIVNALGTIVFGLGNGKFTAPVSYAVENSQFSKDVVLGELRKNGGVDIVAAQYEGVSVLLNLGKGLFEDGDWISVPGAGSCAAAGDFNGDGKPDLAVPTTEGIVILLGTGKTSPPYTIGATIPLSGPGCPIAGDLNGDGLPDILEGANSLGGVGAYLNNGDGTFTLASVVPVGPGIIVFGDFNHDGKLDFADSSNQLALGNGDGTFQPPVIILANPLPDGYSWIAAGDTNNDGWTDILLTSDEYDLGLTVLVNNQQGGFTQTFISNGACPQGVALADLNHDGNLDAVLWPGCGSSVVYVYLGDGKGGFTLQKQTPSYPGLDTCMLAIGDVNGDGMPDLLLPADGSLGIAYGKGDGTFKPTVAWGVGGSPGQILLENLHGQPASANLPDIVSPDSGGGVTVLINTTKK